MFRSLAIRCSSVSVRSSCLSMNTTRTFLTSPTSPLTTTLHPNTLPHPTTPTTLVVRRTFGAGPTPPTPAELEARILSVLSAFESVPSAKVTPTASFSTDLGLDSLDVVEVVMALEDEFGIEIPDAEAEKIHSVPDAIAYLSANPHVK